MKQHAPAGTFEKTIRARDVGRIKTKKQKISLNQLGMETKEFRNKKQNYKTVKNHINPS